MSGVNLGNVSFQYEKDNYVLKDICLSISNNESVAIVGANGAGKSTLLRLIVGLELATEGTVCVDDIVVNKKSLPAVRERLGYVFQDAEAQLFMPSVYDDVAFAPRSYGLSENEVTKRVNHALSDIGITHLKNKQTYKLSGGEKKLVSIATILSMKPQLILMDEPTIALDPKNRRNLINILNSLDKTKIIASHDLDMILDTCERTILIKDGEIVRDGKTEEILSDKILLDACGLELPLSMQRNNKKLF